MGLLPPGGETPHNFIPLSPTNLGLKSPCPLNYLGFFTETIQNVWPFCDYPFLRHPPFHSISFVRWGQKDTVLKVRTWLNLHCGAIMFSVQLSRLSHLISRIWFTFLTATKQINCHQFAFTKLSKASRSCSWIAMLSSQPIPDICEALPCVYHFKLKFMPEFPLQSVCTAHLKSLSTFILATLNNFPPTNSIKLSICPCSTQICSCYFLLP